MSHDPDVVVLAVSDPALANALAGELGRSIGTCRVEHFPDGEAFAEVDEREIEGSAVFLVQSTAGAPGERLLELLLVADACRRAGAASVTAAIPYFAYARQDRRTHAGGALGARVVTQTLASARAFDRIFAVDLHSDVVEAASDVPIEHLSAAPLLAGAIVEETRRAGVIVAPDFGAVHLARAYARRLDLPFAIVHKMRKNGTEVVVERVAGEVRGLRPILVDDIVATGGTIVAAAAALRAQGAEREFVVAATHAVLTRGAIDRMREAGLQQLFVTDTVPHASLGAEAKVVSVAPLLAASIRRIEMRELRSTHAP